MGHPKTLAPGRSSQHGYSFVNNFMQPPVDEQQYTPGMLGRMQHLDEFGEEIPDQAQEGRYRCSTSSNQRSFVSPESNQKGSRRNPGKHGRRHGSKAAKKGKPKRNYRKYSSQEDDLAEEARPGVWSHYLDADLNQRVPPSHSRYRASQNPDSGSESDSEDSESSPSSSSSDSSSSGRAKARRERKKKQKKNQKKRARKEGKGKDKRGAERAGLQTLMGPGMLPGDAGVDYHKIIEDEKLALRLGIDNYAMLLYLIDGDDQEVREYFWNHVRVTKVDGKPSD